ncbi:MAG: hypothetical protein A2V66_18245 [Ignavibacteria bacterium RBG_13_36_8]|nr:MAG: hypothetical protein A2V66_18245 [Ignavibacteria bacterium RBG_13_36_8]
MTKILNPWILNFFNPEPGKLIANSKEPILIENKSLGYRIQYILQYFEFTPNYVKYSGIPTFEELIPETEDQKKAVGS